MNSYKDSTQRQELPSVEHGAVASIQADQPMSHSIESTTSTASLSAKTSEVTKSMRIIPFGAKRKSPACVESASPTKRRKYDVGEDDGDRIISAAVAKSTKRSIDEGVDVDAHARDDQVDDDNDEFVDDASNDSFCTNATDFDLEVISSDEDEAWFSASEGNAKKNEEEEEKKMEVDVDKASVIISRAEENAIKSDNSSSSSRGDTTSTDVQAAVDTLAHSSSSLCVGQRAEEDPSPVDATALSSSADSSAHASAAAPSHEPSSESRPADDGDETDDDDDTISEAEAERLRRTISELKAECARLTEERRRIEEEEENRRRERDRLAAEIDRAKAEFARLKAECDRLKRHLAKQEEEIARLRLYLMIAREIKQKATSPEE